MPDERRRGDTEIIENLGYIRGKVDGIHEDIGEVRERLNNHSGRISSLEDSRSKMTAVGSFIAGCGLLVGGIATFWSNLWGGK